MNVVPPTKPLEMPVAPGATNDRFALLWRILGGIVLTPPWLAALAGAFAAPGAP